MPDRALDASVIICESVLNENGGVKTAVRIMDVLTLGPLANFGRFFVLTFLHPQNDDFSQHGLKVNMVGFDGAKWVVVAEAEEYRFQYGYALEPSAPGAFVLSTEFNIDVRPLTIPGTYFVQAFVDGERVQQTPLTLRRRN